MGLKIGVDKNQLSEGSHSAMHKEMHSDLMAMGCELVPLPIPVGDYVLVDSALEEIIRRRGDKLQKIDLIGRIKASVDTKNSPQELYGDIVGAGHDRFSDSLLRAKDNGIQLYILVENVEGITNINEFGKWRNERGWRAYFNRKRKAEREGMKPPKPPQGPAQLIKAMHTMEARYGVKFLFCGKREMAGNIIRLLGGGMDV